MNTIILAALKQVLTLVCGLGTHKKLFILIYHRVLDEPDFMRPGEVDKQTFSWQMALLAKYFHVLSVSDALEKLKTNSLPARAVCITFDDGYADNLLNAVPILKKHQLSASFFIASGYLNGGRMWNDSIIEALRNMQQAELNLSGIDLGVYSIATSTQKYAAAQQIIKKLKYLQPAQRLYLSEQIAACVNGLPDNLMLTHEQLKQLQQHGMAIGGHTVTHPIMAKLDVNAALQEVIDNKNALEKLLKTQIDYFAYPNGKLGSDYLASQVDIIKTVGYQAAFSTHWGVVTANSDLWQLPRFTPWDKTPVKFMLRMVALYCNTVK
ncbi:polysaccharide deacetylase family protein [Crenothrix polyspora]|nr:polysaccharide deacetylase family protein [Crenothrix polyspora]